jgi:hypothetical protein
MLAISQITTQIFNPFLKGLLHSRMKQTLLLHKFKNLKMIFEMSLKS